MHLRRSLAFLLSVGLAASMVSCGGSGGGTTHPATTPVHFDIAWAERSRAIQGPASALSATVTLSNASATGGDLVVTVDRNTDPAAYTQTYTSTTSAKVGPHPMTVRFYAQPAGAGDVVASAQATVTIAANGSGIGDIVIHKKVNSVEVNAGQVVGVGVESQLLFTARDSDNAIVAVSPGSATWTQVDGSTYLSVTSDGKATGIQPGTSHVTVSVDGATSASTAVTVPAPPDFENPGFETPHLNTGQWVRNVDVVGSHWTGDNNWGIANASGSWGIGGHDSSQYAFIQAANNSNPVSHGALKQTINGLTVGTHYRVSLWIARRNGNVGGNTGATITVLANGVEILDPTSPTNTGGYRQILTKTFTATQTSYEFVIQSILPQFTDDTATLVDDVHLELAP